MCLKITVYNKFTIIDLLNEKYSKVEMDALKIKSTDLIQQGHKNLILNIFHLKYIDDKFLKSLKVIHMYSVQNDAQLSLCSPNNEIELILYLSGIDKIIKIFSTKVHVIDYYADCEASKIA